MATFARTVGTPLSGTAFGFDFNPAADRIRIVSDTGQNLNITPTGTTSATTSPLTYSATDPSFPGSAANVAAAAYTNNVFGAAATRLIDYDVLFQDAFAEQTPGPDLGMLRTVATPTVTVGGATATVDVSPADSATVGLDIEAVTDQGLALLRDSNNPADLAAALYAVSAFPAAAVAGGAPAGNLNLTRLGLPGVPLEGHRHRQPARLRAGDRDGERGLDRRRRAHPHR